VDGLIEKRQYPFAGRTILHVRPTSKTKSFLAAATTWNAALEVLAQMGFPCPAWHTDKATQITPSLQEMIKAWGEPSLKPEEVGELATFRQGMTSVVGHEGEYDFSAFTLEVIAWTVENWAEYGTGCKGKKICPKPKIEFFCQNFAIALTLFFKAKGVEPSTPDSSSFVATGIANAGVSRVLGTTSPMTGIKSCQPLTVRRSCGHRLSVESGQVRSASPTQTAVPRNSAQPWDSRMVSSISRGIAPASCRAR
jgi:hypothetical protein